MTLIIAAHGKDFVVLGADSRETVEPQYSPMQVQVNIAEKIVKLSRHSAVLICGDMGQAQYLVEKFKAQRVDLDVDVSKVAEEFKGFCRDEAREVGNVPKYPNYFPDYRFIVAGLDKKRGAFKVPKSFSMGSVQGFRMNYGKEGFTLDGKPMLAYYQFEKYYLRAEKAEFDPLCVLVGQTLYDTRRIDADVGGQLRMALVREKDGFGWIPDEDIVKKYTPDKW